MQLIHLPPYPRKPIPIVNLLPQHLPPALAHPQGIHRRRHHAGRLLLVVEEAEGGDSDDEDEEGEGAGPD